MAASLPSLPPLPLVLHHLVVVVVGGAGAWAPPRLRPHLLMRRILPLVRYPIVVVVVQIVVRRPCEALPVFYVPATPKALPPPPAPLRNRFRFFSPPPPSPVGEVGTTRWAWRGTALAVTTIAPAPLAFLSHTPPRRASKIHRRVMAVWCGPPRMGIRRAAGVRLQGPSPILFHRRPHRPHCILLLIRIILHRITIICTP